ncbi:MAG: PspC domain-containing protein [Herpetosiphonaceae bacterium]|nr:PspC domain-containing protein [Herpetosiphonaceae bacterium]
MQNGRLTRSRNEQMIGGVCAGLAKYFATDITLVRLGFVLLTVLGVGATIPLYIILWLVLPLEGSPQIAGQATFKTGLEEMKTQAQTLISRVKGDGQQPASSWQFDPYTGQPIVQPPVVEQQKPRFDPYTGQPLDQ